MPALTLTWQEHYLPHTEDYRHQYPWIRVVTWRRHDDNTLLPQRLGLYIVVDSTAGAPGVPVYVGQALDFRDRFDGRSNALRELGLTAAPLANRVVKIAYVYPHDALNIAERWLIRYLYLRDQHVNNPYRMQNIEKTGPFAMPYALTITSSAGYPNYLHANYNYNPGDQVVYP